MPPFRKEKSKGGQSSRQLRLPARPYGHAERAARPNRHHQQEQGQDSATRAAVEERRGGSCRAFRQRRTSSTSFSSVKEDRHAAAAAIIAAAAALERAHEQQQLVGDLLAGAGGGTAAGGSSRPVAASASAAWLNYLEESASDTNNNNNYHHFDAAAAADEEDEEDHEEEQRGLASWPEDNVVHNGLSEGGHLQEEVDDKEEQDNWDHGEDETQEVMSNYHVPSDCDDDEHDPPQEDEDNDDHPARLKGLEDSVSGNEAVPAAEAVPSPGVVGTAYSKPGPFDVACGRGISYDRLPGNQHFRNVVGEYLPRYASLTRNKAKRQITMEIINRIQSVGRFLTRDEETRLWVEVDDEVAHSKVGQQIRYQARAGAATRSSVDDAATAL